MSKETERPEGFDDLPKRFKQYVQVLETERDSARKAVPQPGKTNLSIFQVLDRSDKPKQYLPDSTVFCYTLGRDEVHVRLRDHQLEVSGHVSRLVVYPEVSNVVRIGTDDR